MDNDGQIFLKNCWYVAAWDHELLDGRKLARTILEKPVVLFRGESGKYVALDDRCCHRGAPLSMGRIEGDCLRCMYHGMKYDPSGACIEVPGQDRIPKTLRVHSYPIVERGHLLWIWMGDPALADPALIVDYPPLHDPAWRGLPAYLHYDANWLLIVDNLSDLAHLAFVHTNTLGGSEEYAYKSKPPVIEKLDDGFRMERWHRDSEPPPYHKKVIPASEHGLKLDRRNKVTMIVPGMFFMETMFSPAGSGKEDGDGVRQYRNCPVHDAGDAANDSLLLELPAQLTSSTTRTSRYRCATACSKVSTRTRRSSKRSRYCSIAIRTFACVHSKPMQR